MSDNLRDLPPELAGMARMIGGLFAVMEGRAADPVRSRALIAVTNAQPDLGQLMLTLGSIYRGIETARAKGEDPEHTLRGTVGTLRKARADLDAIIGRLERRE